MLGRMTKHPTHIWLSVVGVLLGFALFFGLPGSAAAEPYPYAGMPCVWPPYAADSNQANWCNDYDWGAMPNTDSQASTISPYGYAYRNCTDYAAWKLDSLGVPAAQYKGLGHAKQWAERAPNHALVVDTVPAAGAVAVRTTGTYGHLAYIEEVLDDGRLKISQFNKQATGVYSEDVGVPAAFGFVAFIHFEAYTRPARLPVPEELPIPSEPPETPAVLPPPVEPAAAPVAEPEIVSLAVLETIEPPVVQEAEPLPNPEPAAAHEAQPQPEPVVETAALPSEPQVPPEPDPPPQAVPSMAAPPSVRIVPVAMAHPAVASPALRQTALATPRPSLVATYWPVAGLAAAIGIRICIKMYHKRSRLTKPGPNA